MARPIEATPVLYGKDAERLIKEVEETDRKMREDPEYRKRVMDKLKKCEKIYLRFMSRLVT